MNAILVSAIICLGTFNAIAQDAADNFEGKWRTQDGFTVEIVRKNGRFEGTSLERQKVVMENLQFRDNKWTALMIRPKDKLSAEATVVLKDNEIHIFMKKGPLSKKLTWTKL